ncbi:sigma-70 family RNA polymerase sigma factor [Streptomyces sp. NPDC002588]|uniref:sigma-70 family RNA polymerase sigma factor n=1 Tax=Streptomyces sp. NPDC002588 TaxID=3154419 RepID=UPI0033331585
MSDRSTAASAPPSATARYARIYEEQQPRLVAYARSLTRNAWAAEDLVAEAHFRVWRRLAEGHEIDNVPAYLRTTVRHLAIASGTAVRETPQDPQTDERPETGGHGGDPAEEVSRVDLVVRVLGQLPERWVKALWLAEAEGHPLSAIGPQLGTKEGATAVLLHRAREGMRQAYLRAQTGAPDDPACQVYWARMPAYVRGAATARQGERLLGHVDACDDCRARLAALMRANDRLPALAGPALLVLALGGGTSKFLAAFAAGSAGAAAAGQGAGHGAGLLHGVRDATIGGSKAPVAVAAGALAAGATALFLVLGPAESAPAPAQRTPVADAPAVRVPVTEPSKAPAATVVVAEKAAAENGDRPGPAGAGAADVPAASPSGTTDPAGAEEPAAASSREPAAEPAAEAPATDAPAPEEPTTEEPTTKEPATEEPVTEEPVTEEPVTEEPAPEEEQPTEPADEATPEDPQPSDPGPTCELPHHRSDRHSDPRNYQGFHSIHSRAEF